VPEPRRIKPGWKILGLLALAALAWFGAPALGRRMSFFRVRRIEVVGVRYLDPAAVARALDVPARASVFDDLSGYETKLAAVPGVVRGQVGRRLPGTLRVEVEERTPVALASRRGSVVMIDAAGKVLPYDPARSAPDLPVAERPDSLVAGLLGRVRAVEPGTYALVSAAWRQQDDVVLEVGGRRLLFRPDASAEEIRAVMAVAEDLARQEKTFRELDGRFAGQVVVRGMAASAARGAAEGGA
jgi:cell division protein FtsQ